MPNLLHRLFEVLTGASQADLRRQVQYLRAENQILRARLPGTIRTTPAERARLVTGGGHGPQRDRGLRVP